MKRTRIADALKRTDFGAEINVKGWVRSKRGSKGIFFVAMNDGSTIKNVQVVGDDAKFSEDTLRRITTGACLSVTGTLVESVLVEIAVNGHGHIVSDTEHSTKGVGARTQVCHRAEVFPAGSFLLQGVSVVAVSQHLNGCGLYLTGLTCCRALY